MKKLSLIIAFLFISSCSNEPIVQTPIANETANVKISSDNVLGEFFKDSLSHLFKDLDDNSDGKLSRDEVKNAIWDEKFKSLDTNNNGSLSLEEILANKSSLVSNELELRKRAQGKFKIVDKNSDSFVSSEELGAFYKKDPDETENNKMKGLMAVFQTVDYFGGDKDNKLNFDEFENFMYIFPLSFANGITKKFPEIFS